MGHMGELKQEYRALMERLDRGPVGMPRPEDDQALEGWRELLEILYTPEEAELASRMPLIPTTLVRLAKRFDLPSETLRQRLEPLCDKGLVADIVSSSGEVRYALAPPVVGFFEFSMMRAHDMFDKPAIAKAMSSYLEGDDTFAREVFDHDTVIGRALVHEEELAADIPDVLDWERATALVDGADKLAVSLCFCRHKAEHAGHGCDVPQEVCLSLDGGADFVVRRGFGRAIERTEAREILERARKLGLVQIADNVQRRPAYVCNCCSCCCEQLGAINRFGLHAVNPSGFEPALLDEACNGCSRCARDCPVTAISMVPVHVEASRKNELLPEFDTDLCLGCGVCATRCRKDAITMERRAEPSHVPVSFVERVVRQMLERGRLADLLFDVGQSRGAAFLNHVVKAITRLPPAERMLAAEQTQSRFVAWAIRSRGGGHGDEAH